MTSIQSRTCDLFHGHLDQLRHALAQGTIYFHSGTIRGTMPSIVK